MWTPDETTNKDDSGLQIEPYFADAIVEQNHLLDDFFEVQKIEVLVPVPNEKHFVKVTKDFVFCNDIEAYVTFIANERKYDISFPMKEMPMFKCILDLVFMIC